MNKKQRKALNEALVKCRQGFDELESLRTDLQDSLDNTPENLQSGDRYEARQEEVDALDTATADLESAISALEDFS